MSQTFIKVGDIYIRPDQIRMVEIRQYGVDIYFNGVPGSRAVSIKDAKDLLAFINS